MNKDIAQQYAEAHAAHYQDKELGQAVTLYTALIEAAPDTTEAGYCRAQLQNIANSVVPKPELLATVVELTRTHLERDALLKKTAVPPAAELPAGEA